METPEEHRERARWTDRFRVVAGSDNPRIQLEMLPDLVADAPNEQLPMALGAVANAASASPPPEAKDALAKTIAALADRAYLDTVVARNLIRGLEANDLGMVDRADLDEELVRMDAAGSQAMVELLQAMQHATSVARPPSEQPTTEEPDVDPLRGTEFSSSARDAIGWASAILERLRPEAKLDSAVLFAGFVAHARPQETGANTSLPVLKDLERQLRTGKRDIVRRLLGPDAVVPRQRGTELPPAERYSPEVETVIAAARRLALAAGDGHRVRVRHLLAALLTPHERGLPAVNEVLRRNGVDLARLRGALEEAIRLTRPTDNLQFWNDVLTTPEPPAAPRPTRAQMAGYTSDTVGFDDQLGIEDDVNTLASVLAARTVEPPVSVGLFGDWGTGKTFFMTALERRLDAIQRAARGSDEATVYCRNIKHIRFNAWHYADANLWASLVTEIFEGLAAQEGGAEAAQARERLLKLETSQLALKAAQEARERALQRKREVTKRIRALEATELKRKRLDRVTLAGRAVAPEVKSQLDRVATEGATDSDMEDKPVQDLARDLAGIAGAARTVARVVGGRRLALGALAILVLGGVVFAFVQAFTIDLVATISGLLTAAGSAVAFLRPRVARARAVAELAAGAVTKVETELREAQTELIAARGERDRLDAQLAEAEQNVEVAEEEVKEIRLGRRLTKFVEARARGDDYRKHLGLVSLIRRDFLELNRLMLDAPRDDGDPETPPLDRIVLYIDDLDRCGPERVVEVLEAIHLLLALRLFVVIVAVDSRWLLRSLQIHYSALRTLEDDSEDDYWAATPQNYLEKIFQIPYAVRPMASGGYRDLIKALLPAEVAAEPVQAPVEPAPAAAVDAEDHDDSPPGDWPGDAPLEPRVGAGRAQEKLLSVPRVPEGDLEPDIDLAPEALLVTETELQSMQKLDPLIGTPRAAKRLVNTYRLARASLTEEELEDFVDRPGRPGDHRVALVLLGTLIGFPTIAEDFFERLLGPIIPATSTWRGFVTAYNEHSPRIAAALDEVSKQLELPDDLASYRRWAVRVGRYSFHTSRLVMPGT